MKKKLFIFDLDGVLINSNKVHFEAFNSALSLVDKKYMITQDEQETIFEGLTTNQKLKILTKTRGFPVHRYDYVWEEKQKACNYFFENIKIDNELIGIFQTIKEHKINIAVASNASKKILEKCLTSLGIIDLLDFWISGQDNLNPKPSSDLYLKCMEYFNVNKFETIIFEDSYIGKVAAYKSEACLFSVNNRSDITLQKILEIIEDKKKTINILIPMAGEGSRFKEVGFKEIKPLIPINGKAMIQHVIENIGIDGRYIFVVKKEHEEEFLIEEKLKKIIPNCVVIIQEGKLDGAAISTYLAKDIIDNDENLLIVNSDQLIDKDGKNLIFNFINSGVDGGILTFQSTDPKWSFVQKNMYDLVDGVAEKNVISDEATCGWYFWNKGSDYLKYVEKMVSKNIRTNNEFYVCPVYNEAIADGKVIVSEKVKNMWGLGTPADLQNYLNNDTI